MDATSHQSAILSDMLEPLTDSLTLESAKRLANLKAKASVQVRLDELAEKSNEGTLTQEETEEYEMYVRVGSVLNLLKAKARQALSQNLKGSDNS